MGNAAAPCKLTTDDTVRLSSSSVFNPAEIRALWFHFDAISNKQDKVSKAQFQSAMLFQDSILMDRIFAVFDADNDNLISFDDYVACLSTVSNKAKPEDKLKCALVLVLYFFPFPLLPHTRPAVCFSHRRTVSFKIYDCDGDGFINTGDLTAVVAATLREQDVVIARTDLDQIVEQTMKEAHPATAGKISYDEYLKLVANRPYMLSHMTLNISGTIAEYTSKPGVSPVKA